MATEATDATSIIHIDDAVVERALRGQLKETEVLEIEDPVAVQRSIIERILASPDAESVLGGQKAIGGIDCLDRPFELRGVRWHRSAYTEGENALPVFAVLDAYFLDDGEQAAITTGSASVMAQAYALSKMGALPIAVKFIQSDKPTASGFRPQSLVQA